MGMDSCYLGGMACFICLGGTFHFCNGKDGPRVVEKSHSNIYYDRNTYLYLLSERREAEVAMGEKERRLVFFG